MKDDKALELIRRLLVTLTRSGSRMDGKMKFYTSHKSQAVIREMLDLVDKEAP